MERVILLTSTVKPYIGGFAGTVEKRLQEYEDAISYYLQETTFDIVVVDNSNYLFRNSNKRLRSYAFLADPEDFKYGKGFGEAKIISYAFKHDAGLQKAEQVIKITGRHKISNINKLVLQTTLVNTIYADCNLGYTNSPSCFFIAPPVFYNNYLLPYSSYMNDSKGIYFEHILARSIKKFIKNKGRHRQFYIPIAILGHPGTSSVNYKLPNRKRYLAIYIKYWISLFANKFGLY